MRVRLVAVVCGLLVLAGCSGAAFSGLDKTAATVAGAQFNGVVHGGQQSVVGAKVFLLAANTTGYGGNGIAASASNASVSLLKSAGNTVQDTNSADPTYLDYYTTTGTGGSFTITGDYSCTPGTQVYIYALGGNPAYPDGSVNSGIGLLAALGPCPGTDSFPSSTYVVVNEVSTIATAYAFAGFATDALHVSSSGTALAQTGIANAFANVANLETLSTGASLATTPAGNGTVPQANINTLADILAACVNTSGPSSSGCSTLFTNAMSAGSTGTTATDTATAAINIAHYPGSNIAALYALSTATPPFAPALTAQPKDFTIGLGFSGAGLVKPGRIAIDSSGGVWTANYGDNGVSRNSVSKLSSVGAALSPSTGYTGGGLNKPLSIAIDGSGNAWLANSAGSSLSTFSNAGVALSPSTGYLGGGLDYPNSIAIDGSGNVWISNIGQFGVSKFSEAGTALSPSTGYTGGGIYFPNYIAIDGSGNAWIANFFNSGSVSELSNAGTPLSPDIQSLAGGLDWPMALAIDGSGNVWTANNFGDYGNSVSKFTNAGTPLSPIIYGYSGGYYGGGVRAPTSIAIDGAGDAWLANYSNTGGVSELSNLGTALSPSTGYASTGLSYPFAIAIDGSGNVWITSSHNDTASELIGAATPVITPICAGLPAIPTADGTSNLGTRP